MKFIIAFSDPNQPYSCIQWGNMPDGGASQIATDTGYDIWELFESGGAFPSTVFIDHEMRVYDKMNNAGSWSIGNRIDAMLEECGDLCGGDECAGISLGDINEDTDVNVLDVILAVNHVLETDVLTDCALNSADMNQDGSIDITDIVLLVNLILV